jgi:hypothetical protein
MAKQNRISQRKKDSTERKRHKIKPEDSRKNSKIHDATSHVLPITPFSPRMEEHAAHLSEIPFAAQREDFIRRLHQTYGSRYVQRLMKSVNVQAKLTISSPDDVYEQEADRVADAVTGAINKQVQRQVPEEEEELLQGKLAIARQTPEEEEELLQGKLAVARQTPEEEEELLQSKLAINRQTPEEEEELLQGKLAVARQTPEEEEELLQSKLAINRQTPEEEEELLQGKLAVQRQTPEEEEELLQGKLAVQRQTPEEEEELLQGKFSVRRQVPEEEELQMEPVDNSAMTVADDVETRINSARGGGQPLSEDVQEPMERAFGADFTDVRTHTDSEADTLNKQLNARAFTTGSDIFFREGEYSPGSSTGQHLIAHELTHVVQQTGARQLQRNGDDEEGQVPAEAKKEGFWKRTWNKLKAILSAVGEAAWEAVQELVVDAVEGLGIFSVFAGFVKLWGIVKEAIEARKRQKAYQEKLDEEDITPKLMQQVEYGEKNSFKQFTSACTEFAKEVIILINDVIAVIGGALTAGVLTAAAECINLCLSITSWVGKQFKKFINWLVGGDRKRKKRATVIVNAAVDPGAEGADRDMAVDLITDLHVAVPVSFIKWWEEEHEVIRPPDEVDKDMLDWIRRERGETRENVKDELTESIADTMQGFFW